MTKITDIKIPDHDIKKILGRGGMATVYLATHHRLHRDVALKVMSSEIALIETHQKSFINEGRTVARLEHPNIVKIHDINAQGNHIYMSTEVLNGGTLKERLTEGKLPISNTLRIIDEMANALDYAHKKSYIHRDIKPANIMFREDGSAVLTDFGIAKIQGEMGDMTQMGYVSGTPYYMSPEQATGQKDIDQRTDIYSLSVVFYEMLAGKKPFTGDNTVAITYGHVHNSIPILEGENSIFQPVLDKGLAKKPEDRFKNTKEFSAAAQKLWQSDGETIFITPIEDDENKNALPFWILATLIISSSVVGAGGYYYASQPKPSTEISVTSFTQILATEKDHPKDEELNLPSLSTQLAEKEQAVEKKREHIEKLKNSVEAAHLLFKDGKLEEAKNMFNEVLEAPDIEESLKNQAQMLLSNIEAKLKRQSALAKLSPITITSDTKQAKSNREPYPKLSVQLNNKAYLHCLYQAPPPENQKILQLYPSPKLFIQHYKLPKKYGKYKKTTQIKFPIGESLSGLANIYCFSTDKAIRQAYLSLFSIEKNGLPYSKKGISIKTIEQSISDSTKGIYKKASLSLEFTP
jgi:serine/threonine protein kinase